MIGVASGELVKEEAWGVVEGLTAHHVMHPRVFACRLFGCRSNYDIQGFDASGYNKVRVLVGCGVACFSSAQLRSGLIQYRKRQTLTQGSLLCHLPLTCCRTDSTETDLTSPATTSA